MTAPKPYDPRSAAERQAANLAAQRSMERSNYFAGLRAQPDFGWAAERETRLPGWMREEKEMMEDLSQAYADLGWGSLRVGPQAASTALARERLSEARAKDKSAWRRYVESAGEEQLPQVPGSNIMAGAQRGQSPFSAITGPLLGAVGYGMGGPIAGMAGSTVGGWLGQEQDPYGIWRRKQ